MDDSQINTPFTNPLNSSDENIDFVTASTETPIPTKKDLREVVLAGNIRENPLEPSRINKGRVTLQRRLGLMAEKAKAKTDAKLHLTKAALQALYPKKQGSEKEHPINGEALRSFFKTAEVLQKIKELGANNYFKNVLPTLGGVGLAFLSAALENRGLIGIGATAAPGALVGYSFGEKHGVRGKIVGPLIGIASGFGLEKIGEIAHQPLLTPALSLVDDAILVANGAVKSIKEKFTKKPEDKNSQIKPSAETLDR